jgi:hypothetical protein
MYSKGMPLYTLIKTGLGPSPHEVAERVEATGVIAVRDQFGSNLVLEGDARAIRDFVAHLQGWQGQPNRKVRPPKTGPALRTARS